MFCRRGIHVQSGLHRRCIRFMLAGAGLYLTERCVAARRGVLSRRRRTICVCWFMGSGLHLSGGGGRVRLARRRTFGFLLQHDAAGGIRLYGQAGLFGVMSCGVERQEAIFRDCDHDLLGIRRTIVLRLSLRLIFGFRLGAVIGLIVALADLGRAIIGRFNVGVVRVCLVGVGACFEVAFSSAGNHEL